MATGVTLYQSTDVSAPVLTGQAGSLTALLDAILVNGYGTKAGAGWTKPFTATNQRSYLQGTKTNFLQSYLHVDDNTPQIANEARVVASEAAGTTGFVNPTTGGVNNKMPNPVGTYLVWRKSSLVDVNPHPWVAVADPRTLVLWISTGDFPGQSGTSGFYGYYFGDFYSFVPGDQYNVALCGFILNNDGSATGSGLCGWNNIGDNGGTYMGGGGTAALGGAIFVDRPVTGQGTSIRVTKHYDQDKCVNSSAAGSYQVAYPNLDGKFYLGYAWLNEWRQSALRGYLRGFWKPLHWGQNVNDRDIFTGAAGSTLVNRSFLVVKNAPYNSSFDVDPSGGITASTFGDFAVLETSDTWDTN